jgi:hypothetical protein
MPLSGQIIERGFNVFNKFGAIIGALSACVSSMALAQTTAVAPAPQQAMIVGQNGSVLRIGTPIPVRTRTELTTKNKALRVGQRFEVETAEPVSLNGQVVIPVGTPGVGEVTSVRNKGMWGKSGHFDVRLLSLRVGDRQIRISGIADDKGKAGGGGAAAVSALVFLPAGFFMTGTSARLPAGTIITASLDEDVPVAFAGAAPAPLVAVAAAPPVAPTVPAATPAPTKAAKAQ